MPILLEQCRFALPARAVEPAMKNFTELFKSRKVRVTEQYAAWLTRDACSHANKSIRAMAALCIGLQLYDAGKRWMLLLFALEVLLMTN